MTCDKHVSKTDLFCCFAGKVTRHGKFSEFGYNMIQDLLIHMFMPSVYLTRK